MKKGIIVILLLTLAHCSYSQSYIPTIGKGRVWQITIPMGLGNFFTYSLVLSCDTQINALNYLKMFAINASGTKSNTIYSLREDTVYHKIYQFNNSTGTEKLIIDYDIGVGAIFQGMDVDSIKNTLSFGQVRKVIYFDPLYKWIEGIGNSFNGLSDTITGFSRIDTVYNVDTSCLPLSLPSVTPEYFEVNQIGTSIHIKTKNNENTYVRILSTSGQIILTKNFYLSTEIDLSRFSSQFLFLEINADGHRVVKKVLIP